MKKHRKSFQLHPGHDKLYSNRKIEPSPQASPFNHMIDHLSDPFVNNLG